MQETQEIQIWSLSQEDPLEEGTQPFPVPLPGEPHEQRSLVGYSSRGHKEPDRTQWAQHRHTHRNTIRRPPGRNTADATGVAGGRYPTNAQWPENRINAKGYAFSQDCSEALLFLELMQILIGQVWVLSGNLSVPAKTKRWWLAYCIRVSNILDINLCSKEYH